jgi:aerobic carbon-monoxide dehydrogenase small subunit
MHVSLKHSGRRAGEIPAMSDKVDIKLNINGHDFAVRVEPRKTLVDVIRDECGLTGTHIGC